MKIQLIRNATLRLQYGNHWFLIDPYFADMHAHRSCAGISANPMVELPYPPEEIIAGIDMVGISHLHSDHYDLTAQRLVPKELKVFCQPGDEAVLEGHGFRNTTPVVNNLNWNGIKISRIKGQHGSGKVLKEMGKSSGFVFEADNEPTIYWAGDTIWCEAVLEAIDQFQPEIIITHSCGAVWDKNTLIVMDASQTVQVCLAAPRSIVIATHMESEDHATVSRQELRTYAEANGIEAKQLLIPVDGEIIPIENITKLK